MTLIKTLKKRYVKLFTLGKKFSSQTFSDNLKKFLLNGIGLFVVVTFTFYVESVGDEYEKKERYKEIVSKIPESLRKSVNYSDEYLETSEYRISELKDILEKWETDNDSIFITAMNNEFYSPFTYFELIIEYAPPFIGMKMFESGDQEFKMLYPEISEEIEKLTDGEKLNHILSGINKDEKDLINKYTELVYSDFSQKLDISNLNDFKFWVYNREEIQRSVKLKYIVNKRLIGIRDFLVPNVKNYKSEIIKNLKYFDSVNNSFKSEKYFLYWKIN